MSLDEGIHLANEAIRVDPATARAAALHVCSAAVDVDDAEQLLQALGLIPLPRRKVATRCQ